MMRNAFRKTIISLLIMLVIGGICHTKVSAAAWTGSGTEASPYLITNESTLRQLATNVNNGSTYSGKYFYFCDTIIWRYSSLVKDTIMLYNNPKF